jgi:hypothetical protein
MKNLFSIIIFTTFLACCNKDDNPTPTNPVDQLPPATQTGANTFGCLLDGEVFKPGLTNNSYNCFYQLVDGEYYFAVTANNTKNNVLKAISVGTEKLSISQGQTLTLLERAYGNANGRYFIGSNITGIVENYYTSTENTGELKITKLDFTNNIVSGTFYFDVKDNQGIIHQIRDGRFDMQFTQ